MTKRDESDRERGVQESKEESNESVQSTRPQPAELMKHRATVQVLNIRMCTLVNLLHGRGHAARSLRSVMVDIGRGKVILGGLVAPLVPAGYAVAAGAPAALGWNGARVVKERAQPAKAARIPPSQPAACRAF